MDITDLRTYITALSFIVFAGIVCWAYSSRQRERFSDAANLPFLDSDLPKETGIAAKGNHDGVRS